MKPGPKGCHGVSLSGGRRQPCRRSPVPGFDFCWCHGGPQRAFIWRRAKDGNWYKVFSDVPYSLAHDDRVCSGRERMVC